MAIAAIDAVLGNVMLVAERHRLIERHADIRRVWRPEDFVCRPACAADQNDSAENCDASMDVRVSREDLGHEKKKVSSSQINRACKQAGTPAVTFSRPTSYRLGSMSASAVSGSPANLKPTSFGAAKSTFFDSAST